MSLVIVDSAVCELRTEAEEEVDLNTVQQLGMIDSKSIKEGKLLLKNTDKIYRDNKRADRPEYYVCVHFLTC
jgi:hypothetical protein